MKKQEEFNTIHEDLLLPVSPTGFETVSVNARLRARADFHIESLLC